MSAEELERLRADFATAVQRAGQAHADAERKIADVLDRTEVEVERLRAERDELKTAIAMVRADCRTMAAEQPPADPEHTTWLAGSRAQATRVLNILTALGVPESSEGES